MDIASQTNEEKNRKPSDSRVSLLTGIARRYVKEIRHRDTTSERQRIKISPIAKLVAEWITNPRFLGKTGDPMVLPRLKTKESKPSFEELANKINTDIRPRTLLDNLIERNLVEQTKEDSIRLLASAYKPDDKMEDLIDHFAVHMQDHLACSTHNLVHLNNPYFDRSAFHDKLSEKSVEKLNKLIENEGTNLLKKVYANASILSVQDRIDGEVTMRYRLGIYAFSEEENEMNAGQSS